MDYVEMVLGIQVRYESWQYEKELPYHILDSYQLRLAVLEHVKAIFLYPKTELAQMASVKKQISKIQQLEPVPVVLILEKIDRHRREYMIAARIPFIVPEQQIYLPFMGIALQDKFKAEVPQVEQLQPSTQVLFFYYLYQKKEKLYANEGTKALGFSSMTISRAVRQLEQTGLFAVDKEGVQKVLVGKYSGRELFDKMQPYLISPVKKKLYVKKEKDFSGAYIAGMSALAEKSRMNPSLVQCYAVNAKQELGGTSILLDAETQVEIEFWKYDPHILSRGRLVDTLSLIMSLKGTFDERVEDAIGEMLNVALGEG